MKMSKGAAGVVTQFSSYTIKQAELIYSWVSPLGTKGLSTPEGKAGATKLLTYLAVSAGVKEGLKEFLDTDVSTAIGVGISWGELIQSVSDASQSDWENAAKNWKLAFGQEGAGILPSGPIPLSGPALGLVRELTDSSKDIVGKTKGVIRELTPVQYTRIKEFTMALNGGDTKKNEFPIYKLDGWDIKEVKYTLPLKELIMRTFGPKPMGESREQLTTLRIKLTNEQIAKVLSNYRKALEDGNVSGLVRLMEQYGGILPKTDMEQVQRNKYLRENFPVKDRDLMRRSGTEYGRKAGILETTKP
jgi:hypothetical protein